MGDYSYILADRASGFAVSAKNAVLIMQCAGVLIDEITLKAMSSRAIISPDQAVMPFLSAMALHDARRRI